MASLSHGNIVNHVNSVNSINHVNSVNSVNSVKSVNSVNSVNSVSGVLAGATSISDGIFRNSDLITIRLFLSVVTFQDVHYVPLLFCRDIASPQSTHKV